MQPIPLTIEYREYLLQNISVTEDKINEYGSLCMKRNCFQNEGKAYKQNTRIVIGKPLSPFLENILMSKLETAIKKERQYFPQ